MKFRLWLEAKIGGSGSPLYHAHPNVEELKKKGFTKENIDAATGVGIASVMLPSGGGRAPYGAAGIHLSRNLDFCVRWAKNKYGPEGGVVEVTFNTRKPFYVPESATAAGKTAFKVFVNPEEKYLVPMTGNKKVDTDQIALAIEKMRTTQELFRNEGHLPQHSVSRDSPLPIQAKALAREFIFGGQGFTREGWSYEFREINPAFEEEAFTVLHWGTWQEWAAKGYLDSVWWGAGSGPFHGEAEVTVFDPRKLRVGSIVYMNRPDLPIPRARRRW